VKNRSLLPFFFIMAGMGLIRALAPCRPHQPIVWLCRADAGVHRARLECRWYVQSHRRAI